MSQEAMAVMRRDLVVANRTLQGAELRDELRHRTEAEPSSFYLLVPDTPAADYPDAPAAADVLQPGMTWWATDYRGPASDEEATLQARQRLGQMLAELDALGIPAEGELGSARPLEAMEKALADQSFDGIIVATLPRHLSRWLRADLPHRAERRFGLPVTTIVTRRRHHAPGRPTTGRGGRAPARRRRVRGRRHDRRPRPPGPGTSAAPRVHQRLPARPHPRSARRRRRRRGRGPPGRPVPARPAREPGSRSGRNRRSGARS